MISAAEHITEDDFVSVLSAEAAFTHVSFIFGQSVVFV